MSEGEGTPSTGQPKPVDPVTAGVAVQEATSAEKGEESLAKQIDTTEKRGIASFKAGSLTALVIVMILFIRIMAVSRWNWDTAAELAEAFDFDDAVPILFGTLFELPVVTGLTAGILLPLAIYRLYLLRKDKNAFTTASDWLLILLLLIVLFVLVNSYALWWPIVVAVVLTVMISIFASQVRRGTPLRLLNDVTRRIGTVLAVVMLVLAVTVTTPWNPREEIHLKDEVIHGHIIDVTPGFVKVLTDDREVRIFLTGDIDARKTIDIEE